METRKDNFLLSTDKRKLDIAFIHHELANSYWATNIPREIVERSIENSLCFGIYDGDKQVGFARVVSDYATFAHLCDVFVTESYRGRGLSKWLMMHLMAHPQLQGLRGFTLGTKDAHGLYAQFGFTPVPAPERLMVIAKPGIYEQRS